MTDQSKDKKSFFKEWLEQLQQESWQLELLISGLALFGIWESREMLSSFDHYVDSNVYGGAFNQITFLLLFILKVGWRIFFINLLIHVILRGLWIGSIGLRYISGDIEYENLDYSEAATEFLKKRIGTYDDFIEKLEWICSVLFAYTFLLFLLFLSMTLFFAVPPVIIKITGPNTDNAGFFIVMFNMIYYVIGLLVFIDFIALGAFKKIKDKTVSKVYLYIFRFYSIVTLSFLYRPLLYNFLDNKGTRRLFFFSIPYILILAIGPNLFSNNNYPYFDAHHSLRTHGQIINDANYEDLRSIKSEGKEGIGKIDFKNNMPDVILGQFYMEMPFQRIFFGMRQSDLNLFKQDSIVSPIYKEGFRFSLFSSSKFEDPELDKLLKAKDDKANEVREKLKVNRDQLKGVSESDQAHIELTQERDRLRAERDSYVSEKSDVHESFAKQKNEKILEAFMDYIELELDGIPYKDSLTCYFYIHPDINQKGVLCHFDANPLSRGNHNMSVKRKVYRTSQTGNIDILHYILPFIKVN
tara:strand:+ start:321 stop:1898 length:1578 start_codon:yes stop_codon:yes gene_type:complete